MNQFSGEYHITDPDPGKHPLPYIRGGKFSFILFAVILFHIFLVILPFFILKISDLFNPPLAVEQVQLVDSGPKDSSSSSLPAASSPAKEEGRKQNEKELFPLPDIPDIPDLPPLPEEKKVSRQEAAPPVEKVIEKKAGKETLPQEKKPKKQYTKPQNIKISTKKVSYRKQNSGKKTRVKKSASQLRAERIRALLNAYDKEKRNGKNFSSGNFPSTHSETQGNGRGTKSVSSQALMTYYEQVRIYLMRVWKQPNTALLNNTRPEVLITVSVDDSGRILSSRILKRSGNSAMDSSVEAMLQNIKVLPKPPRKMQFTINVNIE